MCLLSLSLCSLVIWPGGVKLPTGSFIPSERGQQCDDWHDDAFLLCGLIVKYDPFKVQDPSYPVYVDSSVMIGMTGEYKEGSGFDGVEYMVCRPDNQFFPDLSKVGVIEIEIN